MKILFVCDNLASQTNGTTITTMRFARELELIGHEVYLLTNELSGDNVFTLETRNIPLVSWVAAKQKTSFAKPNKKIIAKALEGVDIVHLLQPWKISHVVLKEARKRNIPVTMAFHVQPEHITYGAKLKSFNWILSKFIYKRFKKLYKKGKLVHCPSYFVANELIKNNYPNQFKVISNGVLPQFYNFEKKLIDNNNNNNNRKFKIVSVGRYSIEKNQQVLIKAISKSKYKSQIELYLPGSGPNGKRLEKLSNKLEVNTKFGFMAQPDLINLLKEADLYVHPAIAETEAISCIEAIASGNVALIANSKLSATPQFALDQVSLFDPYNEVELKNKIEYFLDNPKILFDWQKIYYEYGQKFHIKHSIELFIDMLNIAIADHKNENLLKTKKAREFRKWISPSKVSQSISFGFYYLIVYPLLYLYFKFIMNVSFVNLRNSKKRLKGAVIVSNHVHPMDSPMSGVAFFPKKLIYTSIKENFDLKVAGKLVKILGSVPIPTDLLESRVFFHELVGHARGGKIVHFFPEGELILRNKEIGEMKRGAFKVAVEASVPIIPVFLKFIPYETKFRKKKKYKTIYTAATPIYPDFSIKNKDAINKMLEETKRAYEILSKQ